MMNKLFAVLGLGSVLLGTFACTMQPSASSPRNPEYRNPILFADYSDPDVIRVDNNYYLVASTFHFSPGIPVLKSADLVHWTIIAHVLPRLTFDPKYDLPGPVIINDSTERYRSTPEMGSRYAAGIWAPAIRHHNGRFYVYFPTPTEGIFMSSAEKPEGPWSAPLAVVPEPKLEDPCPFWDDDGQAYLIHSRVGAGPLILRKMSADGTRVLDAGKVIVEDPKNLPTLEGPKMIKRNGWYYIFAPFGGVGEGPQAVLRSRAIYGPYEYRTVLEKGTTNVQAPHQGGYVETPSGQGWFVHFNQTDGYGRIVHLQPVEWRDDWPVIGDPIPGSVAGQPVMTHAMPNVGIASPLVFPQTSDEFNGSALGVQWEWNHNPDDSKWSLQERRGFLRLHAMPATDLVAARNTLTQVLQGEASQMEVRVDVSRMTDAEKTGLAMFQLQPAWIGVVQQGDERFVTYSSAGIETRGPKLTQSIVRLRINIDDGVAEFSYSNDQGASFATLGKAKLRFSWWKGSRPALFTYNASGRTENLGMIDVDWFRWQAR
jgi:beta-xylosidase